LTTIIECEIFGFGAILRFFSKHFFDIRTKHFRQFAINSRRAGEKVTGFEKVFAAIKTRDNTASFANDQRAGSNVP